MSSTAATAQTPLTPLASFAGNPNSLIQYPDGNFYGTSGSGAGSTFFRMTPAGAITVLHTFTAAEGGGRLTLGSDGNFYGATPAVFNPISKTTSSRAFRLTPSGNLTLLPAGFAGSARFMQASDGNLYGSAQDQFCGTSLCTWTNYVFRMTFAGVKTTVQTFNSGFSQKPTSIDVEAGDGNFYGTVFLAHLPFSPTFNNRMFRMTPAGVETTVHTFTGGDDGEYGFVRVQGSDGNLYGVRVNGWTPARADAIFRLTPAGTLTILHSFAGGATDGALPTALIEATDGNLYGITTEGGPANLGTVFKLTPGGDFTLLHTFDGSEGSPQSFLQGLDGLFYGTTATLAWSLPGPPITGQRSRCANRVDGGDAPGRHAPACRSPGRRRAAPRATPSSAGPRPARRPRSPPA